MDKRKNFIKLNEYFTCQNCQEKNIPLKGSCRNHCFKCLHSLHVDKEIPGDRESTCLGIMNPISLDQNGKKGYLILHQCQKCGKEINNKVAEDDNWDQIIKVSQKR